MHNTVINYLQIGQKVYSAVHGKELTVLEYKVGNVNPIVLEDSSTGNLYYFTETGAYIKGGECMIFPSCSNRDWNNFPEDVIKHKTLSSVTYTIQEPKGNYYLVNNEKQVFYSDTKINYGLNNFEPFDRVLVRNSDSLPWKMNFFSHMNGKKYVVMCGIEYNQCVPYNESTKHLLKNEAN
jgi:hypothetical protein